MKEIHSFLSNYALEIFIIGWSIYFLYYIAKETYWWWIGRKGFVITLDNEDLKRGDYVTLVQGAVCITSVVWPGLYKVILIK